MPTTTDRVRLFHPPSILAERRPDGMVLQRSAEVLGPHPPTVVHWLREWATADPARPLVAERSADGGWRVRSYGEVVAAADAVAEALLARGLGPDRPLMILSGNSVDHLVVTMAAMTGGIPAVPVSTAYSLQSVDHARIRGIAGLVGPGAVFADDADRYGPALDALGGVATIVSHGRRRGADRLADLEATVPGAAAAAAWEGVGPDGVAKILFTSGSTGSPKGVVNTHRMLAANQQMMRQAWPFLATERPVIVDWLPWSHTFGGNHNLHMAVTSGGVLYVDAGRPAPGLFAPTLANLAEVPPTIYFNVPAGFAQLVPALEADPALAERFFSRLRLIFNAAAALPEGLRSRLADLAAATVGRAVPVTGSWGMTETAPAATTANFAFDDARCIGAPLPGLEFKLVPTEDAYELRVKGPTVTPGFTARPDLTAEAFDDEGFYRTGDAVVPADPADPNAGLLFRGRTAEDFKLLTGTFVRVGAVRASLLSACPLIADAVIAGEGRDHVAALVWLNAAEVAARLGPLDPRETGGLIDVPAVADAVADAVARHNAGAGSSSRIDRIGILGRPAGLDAGEITDKGYVNQRRVLALRAELVDALYDPDPRPGVITVKRSIP